MKNNLKYYGGSGFDSDDLKIPGIYIIKFDDIEIKFTDLNQALIFYGNIDEEKAFFDVTEQPELIDAWYDPGDNNQ